MDRLTPTAGVTAVGLIALAGFTVAAAIIRQPADPAPPPEVDARAPAPLVVRIDAATVAYAPDGQRIALPSGTEIDACVSTGNALLIYDMQAMVVRMPQPCTVERPMFADGFEGG